MGEAVFWKLQIQFLPISAALTYFKMSVLKTEMNYNKNKTSLDQFQDDGTRFFWVAFFHYLLGSIWGNEECSHDWFKMMESIWWTFLNMTQKFTPTNTNMNEKIYIHHISHSFIIIFVQWTPLSEYYVTYSNQINSEEVLKLSEIVKWGWGIHQLWCWSFGLRPNFCYLSICLFTGHIQSTTLCNRPLAFIHGPAIANINWFFTKSDHK